MITPVTPDKQKSEALRKMANTTLERLEKTNQEEYPSNTLLDYYEAMHNLLEALTLREGIKIKGEGAHQELIDYVAKQRGLPEQTRQFLQQPRDYRNRISYEGFMIRPQFITSNMSQIKEIIVLLLEKVKEE